MKRIFTNNSATIAVAVAYLLATQLGLWAGTGQLFQSPFWPPGGVALAAVLLLGYRVWPGLLVGACAAGAWALWKSGAHSAAGLVGGSLFLGAGNTLEAIAGAWLVNRFAGGRNALGQPLSILKFVVLAAASSLLIGASAAIAAVAVTGMGQGRNLVLLWFNSWLSSLLSCLVITPLALAWTAPSGIVFSVKRILEAAALFLTVLLLCLALFGELFEVRTHYAPVSFLIIPVLLWSAWRFGQRGTTAVAFIVVCVATAAAWHGRGPFALEQSKALPLLLQNYLAVITVMSLIIAADVKLREGVELQLRASEQRYRDLFDYNPQSMWLVDYESLRILAVNRATEQEYGYSRADFLAMHLPDFWPEQDRPGLLEMMRQARAGLEMRCDCRHLRKDGTVFDVNVSSRNLLFGGREAAVILNQDITERKRADKQTTAFSELSRRLSAATNAVEAARFVMGTADVLFGWDACVFELFMAGELKMVLALDTLDGRRTDVTSRCTDGAPGTHTLQALKEGARLILRPHPASFSADMEPFGDKLKPSASLMFAPVRVENEPIAVVSVQSYSHNAYSESDLRLFQALADHSGSALNRVRAEAALRESSERLRLALTAGQMGTWTAELRGHRGVHISPELEAMFGLGPGEFSGSARGMFEFVHPEDQPLVWQALRNAVKTEGDYQVEFRFVPRGRQEGWLFARGRAYGGAPGHPARIAGVAMDITARKSAEQEILRLNLELERRVGERTAQLEAINKELEAFSYSVSHDLRAPLRSIRGFSELLLESSAHKLEPRNQDLLRRVCQASQQMDKLIEDLLKLSRVGRSELQEQTVDLSALAQNIVRELQESDPERVVSVKIKAGLRVRGDERLLRIMLDNLLRNAWKFSSRKPDSKIEFGFTQKPQPSFFVRDNGAGFEMAYATKLFGVFQRLHSASEFPGTGVGLATVQRIINRHGGRIWAEAEPEKGATFYFTLPAASVTRQAQPEILPSAAC